MSSETLFHSAMIIANRAVDNANDEMDDSFQLRRELAGPRHLIRHVSPSESKNARQFLSFSLFNSPELPVPISPIQLSERSSRYRYILSATKHGMLPGWREYFDQWLGLSREREYDFPTWFLGSLDNSLLASEHRRDVWEFIEVSLRADATVTELIEGRFDPLTRYSRTEEFALPFDRGLFLRPWLLTGRSWTTNPVQRGYEVMKKFLCDHIPAPDPSTLPESSLDLPLPNRIMTTRERFAAKTSTTACQSCHLKMDGIGFVLESFDGIGRFRAFERVSPDVAEDLPLDVSAWISLSSGEYQVSSARELTVLLANSMTVHQCFTESFFEYIFGRKMMSESERSILGHLAERSQAGELSINELFAEIIAYGEAIGEEP